MREISANPSAPAMSAGFRLSWLTGAALLLLLIAVWAAIVVLRLDALSLYFGPVVADEVSYRLYGERLVHLEAYHVCAINMVCDLALGDDPHYPPLYPLLLSLAGWLPSSSPLEAMKLFNIAVASAVMFPVYGIARQILSRDAALAAAVVAGVLPSGFIFPPSLMSENLYIPLFATAFWLAIRQRPATPAMAMLFGVVLVLGFLTKFLHLVLIPFLGLTFLLNQWLLLRPTPTGARMARLGRLLAWSAVIPMVLVAAWVVYVVVSGESIASAFGVAALPEDDGRSAPDPALFMPLVGLHGLAIASALLPYLPAVLILVLAWPWRGQGGPIALYLGSLAAITGFQWVFISDVMFGSINMFANTLHIKRVALDTLPVAVSERYFMMLVPLFVPLAFAGLERLMAPLAGWRRWGPLAVAAGVSMGLALLVQAGLYDRTIWPVPASVTVNAVTAADTLYGALGFPVITVAAVAIGVLIVLAWAGSARQRLKPFGQGLVRFAMITVALAGLATFNGITGLAGAHFAWDNPFRAVTTAHARAIAALLGDRNHDARPILVSFEPATIEAIEHRAGIGIPEPRMMWTHRLSFWTGRPVTVIGARAPGDDRPRYWVSFADAQEDPAITYQVGDDRFQVSAIAPVLPPSATLTVSNFGPRETPAGQGFNVQPSGQSALWIQFTRSDPPSAPLPDKIVLTWDGGTLNTTYDKVHLGMTAEVPPDRYGVLGHHDLVIRDADSQAVIAHLDFIVR